MEIQLQELIDKIKKDGIESASGEAARIKSEAEAEAARIISAAQKEAADIVSRGKADVERSEKAGVAALGQASRNLVLAFKGEIQSLLDKIVVKETATAFNENTFKIALPEILKAWASKSGSDALDVLVPEKELKQLQSWFSEKLVGEIKKGVDLKSDRNLGAGFHIANRDGSAYYDFSAESVAQMLSAYLNPRLAETMKSAAKGI